MSWDPTWRDPTWDSYDPAMEGHDQWVLSYNYPTLGLFHYVEDDMTADCSWPAPPGTTFDWLEDSLATTSLTADGRNYFAREIRSEIPDMFFERCEDCGAQLTRLVRRRQPADEEGGKVALSEVRPVCDVHGGGP